MNEALTFIDGESQRFRIVREMNHGAQGSTFEVEGEQDNKRYIARLVRMDEIAGWDDLKNARREIEVLEYLRHPSIPAYADHVEAEDHLYLIREYAPGDSLQELVDSQKVVSKEDFERIFRQLLEALAYLRACTPPVVHRDIKPANIIDDGKQASLIDFGAAKLWTSKKTATSIGTFGYMAPEHQIGRPEPASDMYSLGITMAVLALRCEPEDLPLDDQTGEFALQGKLHLSGVLESLIVDMTRRGLGVRLSDPGEALERLDRQQALMHRPETSLVEVPPMPEMLEPASMNEGARQEPEKKATPVVGILTVMFLLAIPLGVGFGIYAIIDHSMGKKWVFLSDDEKGELERTFVKEIQDTFDKSKPMSATRKSGAMAITGVRGACSWDLRLNWGKLHAKCTMEREADRKGFESKTFNLRYQTVTEEHYKKRLQPRDEFDPKPVYDKVYVSKYHAINKKEEEVWKKLPDELKTRLLTFCEENQGNIFVNNYFRRKANSLTISYDGREALLLESETPARDAAKLMDVMEKIGTSLHHM